MTAVCRPCVGNGCKTLAGRCAHPLQAFLTTKGRLPASLEGTSSCLAHGRSAFSVFRGSCWSQKEGVSPVFRYVPQKASYTLVKTRR